MVVAEGWEKLLWDDGGECDRTTLKQSNNCAAENAGEVDENVFVAIDFESH